MRTGNVVLDMMIAMSIPLVLQGLYKLLEWLRPLIEEFLFSLRARDEHFSRTIEYEKVSVKATETDHIVAADAGLDPARLLQYPRALPTFFAAAQADARRVRYE